MSLITSARRHPDLPPFLYIWIFMYMKKRSIASQRRAQPIPSHPILSHRSMCVNAPLYYNIARRYHTRLFTTRSAANIIRYNANGSRLMRLIANPHCPTVELSRVGRCESAIKVNMTLKWRRPKSRRTFISWKWCRMKIEVVIDIT